MKRLFYLCTLLILAGCTDMSVNDIYEGANEEFQAFIEDNSSRTYIDGQIRMRWTAEDRVTLFRKSTYNREYMFTGKTGANSGGFRQVSTDDDFWFGYDVKANYAIYPHSADTELDETELYITYNMPSEQTYVENSFGLGANVMVAVADDAQLMFKNVGSCLRVRLYGENVSVSSITLTSKGGEAIAGEAKITPTMGGNPTCEMIGNGQSIRLVCPAPVTISSDAENPTDFWIVVPPVTFSKGFSVTVENSDGETQVFDVNKSVTFKRNSYNILKREVTIDNIPIYHVAIAGTISSLITEKVKYEKRSIQISGYLNDKDIQFISEMAGTTNTSTGKKGILNYLDLSEATIEDNTITNQFVNCPCLDTLYLPNNLQHVSLSKLPNLKYLMIGNGTTHIEELTGATNSYGYQSPKNENLDYNNPEFYVNLRTVLRKFSKIEISSRNKAYAYKNNFFYIIRGGNKYLVACTLPENTVNITLDSYYGYEIYGIEGAFCGFNNLKSVIFSDYSYGDWSEIKSIGSYSFYNCYNLENIDIFNQEMNPDGHHPTVGNGYISLSYFYRLKEILPFAFGNCTKITHVILPRFSFDQSYGQSLDFLDGFSGCTGLKEVDFQDHSRPTIGSSAFSNCTSLTSITIPSACIGDNSGYYALNRLGAFYGCSKLETLKLSENVETIKSGSFMECNALYSVTCWNTTPPTLENNVFSKKEMLQIPGASLNAYKATSGWNSFNTYIAIWN